MNIKEAKEEILHTIQAYTAKDAQGQYRIPAQRQRPLLLMGPPGIGKTAVMEQAARECGVGLVAYSLTHHTRQSAVGLPLVEHRVYGGREYTVTEYTMSEILASVYEQMEQTGRKEGILFIDEINCVSETLAPTMLQFLQCKTFGTHRVPEGWVIAAAGNPAEYNRSARELDLATLDRVRRLDIQADAGVWREYAAAAGVHGAILSYLASRPEHFYRIQGEGEERQFVTARGWEDLSELLKAYESLGVPVTEPVIREYLAWDRAAEDFAAYYRLYETYREAYPAEEILEGTASADALARASRQLRDALPEERMAAAQLLLDGARRRLGEWKRQREDTAFLLRKTEVLRQWPKEGPEPVEAFLDQQERALDIRRRQQVMSREEERQEERGLKALRAVWNRSRERGARSLEEQMAVFDQAERQRQEELRQQEEALGAALDRALDWMAETLGEGQELLLFLADLTRNPEWGRFLSAHPESRYFAFRHLLLVREREEELRRQLQGRQL